MSKVIKPRNPVAQSPLLRKGGVHEKSASAKRQQLRIRLNQQLDDWQDELAFERDFQDSINHKDEVDADMEVIAPVSVKQIKEDLDLVYEIYAEYPKSRQETMKRIIGSKTYSANGYENAPKYNNKTWHFHKLIEILKWIVPLLGIVTSCLMMFPKRFLVGEKLT